LLKKFPKIKIPFETVEFQFEENEFIDPYVTKKDFDFMKRLSEDSINWSLVNSEKKDKFNTFFNVENFFPNLKFIKNELVCVKHQKIFEIPFEKTLVSMFSKENIMASNNRIHFIKELEYLSSDKLLTNYKLYDRNNSCSVISTDYFCSFPENELKKKVDCISFEYDSQTSTLIYVSKPISYNVIEDWNKKQKFMVFEDQNANEPVEKDVGFLFQMEMILLKKITDEKTLFIKIQISPSSGDFTKDRFEIIKKSTKIKEDLINLFKNSKISQLSEMNENDIFSKLILDLNPFEWDSVNQKKMIALYDYENSDENHLNFNQGDIIVFIKSLDNDFIYGCFNGKRGIFPSKIVESFS
jgi:hypothetical protein